MSDGASHLLAERKNIVGYVVRQIGVLGTVPNLLHRIEFGCVGGQPLDLDTLRETPQESMSARAVNLHTATTRADEGLDGGTVDMGCHYSVTDRPLVMGDFDRSGGVDLSDYSHWSDCMSGPLGTGVSPCCRIFDFESDQDVDMNDFAAFQTILGLP